MFTVYYIKNKYNGKIYVGSTVNYQKRIWKHFSMLRNGNHRNRKLQKDFSRYNGEFAFSAAIICEAVPKEIALKYEQIFIDGFSQTYNIMPKAGSAKNRVYTNATRKRMSDTAKKKGQKPPINGAIKLTECEVIAILKRLSKGETQKSIASDYNVSKSCIGSIARGTTWADVSEKFKNEKGAVN